MFHTTHDVFEIVGLPTFSFGVILDSKVRGESRITKPTTVVGQVVSAAVTPRGVLAQECFAENMNQTNGARYLNLFQRDESIHQSHFGTCFHLRTIELAVRGLVLAESVQFTETTSRFCENGPHTGRHFQGNYPLGTRERNVRRESKPAAFASEAT